MKLSTLATQFDVPPNRLYAIRDRLLKQKKPFIDLISGNVTTQGVRFPKALLSSAIASAAQKTTPYKPNPLGNVQARKAIQRFYLRDGISIPPEQIVLSPGTSLSYLYVFKVLASPGDEFLVPSPSYPLFDTIAELAQVKLVPYKIREGARWAIDFSDMETRVTARTKAVILISPHNPTGAVATEEEVAELSLLATRRNLAIVSDEVFSPFVYTGERLARPARTNAPLVFTLNGFSKMLALPGIKLGWIAVSGDPALVRQSLKALEMISDTFLPVSDIAEAAAGPLLLKSGGFQKSFVKEMRARRDLAATILGLAPVEGGFLMTIPLAKDQDEETVACRLLEEERVLVHPGYFYDIEGPHLVVCFANRPAVLKKALEKLIFATREGPEAGGRLRDGRGA